MSLKISVILITNDYARSNTETLVVFPRGPSNACVLLLETASMHECIKCKEYVHGQQQYSIHDHQSRHQ